MRRLLRLVAAAALASSCNLLPSITFQLPVESYHVDTMATGVRLPATLPSLPCNDDAVCCIAPACPVTGLSVTCAANQCQASAPVFVAQTIDLSGDKDLQNAHTISNI